jgi:hypothetical protein
VTDAAAAAGIGGGTAAETSVGPGTRTVAGGAAARKVAATETAVMIEAVIRGMSHLKTKKKLWVILKLSV